MPNAISRHLAVLRAHMAAPFALSQLRRRYVRAEEIRAALDGIRSELHDDSIRAHEPVQVPIGTYGLLTGQHWD